MNAFFFNNNYSYSFNKLLLQKEELEQKHVHLLQVVESEKTAKWQYTQQCEELSSEIKKLRAEVNGWDKPINPLIRSIYSLRLQICSLRREYSHRPSICVSPIVGRGSFSSGAGAGGSGIPIGSTGRGSIGDGSNTHDGHDHECQDDQSSISNLCSQVQDTAELRKIKKVLTP